MRQAASFYLGNGLPNRAGIAHFLENRHLYSSVKAEERQNEHDHYNEADKINQTIHNCLLGDTVTANGDTAGQVP
jgi:hypothetical protein